MFSAFVVCSRVFLTINAETRKLTPPQFALRSSVGPNPFFVWGVLDPHPALAYRGEGGMGEGGGDWHGPAMRSL